MGLSAVRGFWKIIETSRPRHSSSWREVAWRRSRPPKTAVPVVTRAAVGSSPRTANAVTYLPDPLSPTTPTVSPLPTLKVTPS